MAKYKKRADGRYLYQMTIGRDDNGKRKLKNIYADTIKELENKIAEAKTEYNKGTLITETVTVQDLCRMFLDSKEGRTLNTARMYKGIIDKYILPQFAERNIKDIKLHELQEVVNHMAKKGILRSIEIWGITIKQLFDMALSNSWCNFLPYDKLILPKRQKKPKSALSADDIDTITNADLLLNQKVFVYLGLMCGLRKGESLALTIHDIVDGVVKVRKNNVKGKIKGYPKSAAGNRDIPIPNKLMELLNEYLPTLKSEILLPQASNVNKYQTESTYKRFWAEIRRGTGIKITSHILRHTYATKLYYAGVDVKTAQYLLGHSTLQMTLEIYTHLDEKEKAKQTPKIMSMFD